MAEYGKKEPVIKLAPSFKDYLWGGTGLEDRFGKKDDRGLIAESWELSAREGGESHITNGEYADLTLSEYVHAMGREVLGSKSAAFEKFPLLVKFIDAAKPLSVQVHPGDEYAKAKGQEFGKNELWYVVSAKEDAWLYYGLSRDITKDDLEELISCGRVTDVLNKVPVRTGDSFMVKAGTIHAIGPGILICEVQQNSDATFRIDDYARKGNDGNPRELHVENALEVIDIALNLEEAGKGPLHTADLKEERIRLPENEFFSAELFRGKDEAQVDVDETSFVAITVMDGEGDIFANDGDTVHRFKAGDTFFVNAGRRQVTVKGAREFLTVRM